MKKSFLFFIFLIFTSLTFAANVTEWQIIPAESRLTFTGTQNGSPVTGSFKTFTGKIFFDPDHLDQSHVQINVDMNSIEASYIDLVTTLKAADWFNVKIFPQAIFSANNFIKVANNAYQAKGTLTIRDKTQPITIDFKQEANDGKKVRVSGQTSLKRRDFDVGQGEWSSTEEVKDKVNVQFTLNAIKK